MITTKLAVFIAAGLIMFTFLFILSQVANTYSLNQVHSKVVGDGQYGSARWATRKEIEDNYNLVKFDCASWRQGKNLPTERGIIVHTEVRMGQRYAFVEKSDIHTMMMAPSGCGKTAFFLYPNIEYACACGVSFMTTDTKGDLYRNYAGIAEKYYGYESIVIDLRNPTKSHGDNMLHLVNKYMDMYLANPDDLASKAKAEKYAKITAKTIINNGESGDHGQNSYFYDSAEGLIAAVIMLLAEFGAPEERHIVSVFKLIQDMMQPSKVKGKTQLQVLLDMLPPDHMTRMLAGSSLYTAEQAMMSVTSTAMSKLNAFLDSELQQILCFDTKLDAEDFCHKKQALFLVLPEEDNTKYFLISLMIQQLYREIITVSDANGGSLDQRIIFFWDEIGTIPKIDCIEMIFSAIRSRGVLLVPILQSAEQFVKLYGESGMKIIRKNCQCIIYGGFAPADEEADTLSKELGTQTVVSASISHSKDGQSITRQMIQKPLKSADELRTLGRGETIITRTNMHPIQGRMELFKKWGIEFEDKYELPDKAARKVKYADKGRIEQAIIRKYQSCVGDENTGNGNSKTGIGNIGGQNQVMEKDGVAEETSEGNAGQVVIEIEPNFEKEEYPRAFGHVEGMPM